MHHGNANEHTDDAVGSGAHPAESVGGALADDATADPAAAAGLDSGAAPEPGTQNEPAMDMHTTDDEQRIAGIVAQTRADVGDASEERIADVLRQRFSDIGLGIADDRVRALAAEIAGR